ncbi:MAG: hypothetical protein RLZZ618_723 [Pseudomonadota bacterium]
MTPLSPDFLSAALLIVVAACLAAAQVLWVLPSWPGAAGTWISLGLVSTLAAAGALSPSPFGWPLLAGALALAAGHLGWWSARRPVRAKPPAALPKVGAAPVRTAATAGASAVKSTLGRYRIESELGRGSMGTVYLGRDPKIGRAVAIKTMALSKEFHGAELTETRQRFFREAETAGRLQHPDIVTIFDAGEDQDLAYIAMEFLKGTDLQRHTQNNLLPLAVIVRIGARVAEALAYAHSQGVVHRDIKPANVMVDLATDTVKVTDFGIARIADASRTRTGMVLGTPSFMSPEQMAGRRVDGRSDLYSLGVMLFQLITGHLPHRADSMAALMYEIANQTAPDVRNWRPDVPEALAKAIALALDKRPEVRYADGNAMAADLFATLTLLPAEGSVAPSSGETPPNSSGFEATVKFIRPDPGHN